MTDPVLIVNEVTDEVLDAIRGYLPSSYARVPSFIMKVRGSIHDALAQTLGGDNALTQEQVQDRAADIAATVSFTPCTYTLDAQDTCAKCALAPFAVPELGLLFHAVWSLDLGADTFHTVICASCLAELGWVRDTALTLEQRQDQTRGDVPLMPETTVINLRNKPTGD